MNVSRVIIKISLIVAILAIAFYIAQRIFYAPPDPGLPTYKPPGVHLKSSHSGINHDLDFRVLFHPDFESWRQVRYSCQKSSNEVIVFGQHYKKFFTAGERKRVLRNRGNIPSNFVHSERLKQSNLDILFMAQRDTNVNIFTLVWETDAAVYSIANIECFDNQEIAREEIIKMAESVEQVSRDLEIFNLEDRDNPLGYIR